MDNIVTTNNKGEAVTTSLKIAQYLGRNHKSVLASIRNSFDESEYEANGISVSSYNDSCGRSQKVLVLNESAFCGILLSGCAARRKEIIDMYHLTKANVNDDVMEECKVVAQLPEYEESKRISSFSIAGKEFDVYGSVERPLFKAKDVAAALGIINSRDMTSRIDYDELVPVGISDMYGHIRPTTCLTEEGLYEVCLQSRKEVARFFKRRVKEFLIELRRTGQVSVIPQQQTASMTTAQFLLQQAQFMVEQEKRMANIEQKMAAWECERESNGRLLLSLDNTDAHAVPDISLRDKIRERVNAYSIARNTSQQDIYHYIYHQLYYRYKVSVNNIRLHTSETKLNALERLGHLGKVYDIVCSLPSKI